MANLVTNRDAPHRTCFRQRSCCPACAATVGREIYRQTYAAPVLQDWLAHLYQGRVEQEYLEGVEYVLRRCGRCRMVYQEWIPNDDLLKRIYDRWVGHFGNGRHDFERARYANREIGTVIRHFRKCPGPLRVLDFGMGTGMWCQIAMAYGCDTYGYDIAEITAEHAALRGIKIVDWASISLGAFDFINTEQVFEHLAEPAQMLRDLRRCLVPGGVIKLSVPNAVDVEGRLFSGNSSFELATRYSLNAVAPLEHINCFTNRSITEMAIMCDLRPVSLPTLTLGAALDLSLRDVLRSIKYRLVRQNYMFLRRDT